MLILKSRLRRAISSIIPMESITPCSRNDSSSSNPMREMSGKLAWRRLTTCSRMAICILRNCRFLLPEPIEPADDLALGGHDQGIFGNVFHHDGICADAGVTADLH